jgi:hypothetical protein
MLLSHTQPRKQKPPKTENEALLYSFFANEERLFTLGYYSIATNEACHYSLTPIEACHFWYLGFSCILVFWELYPMCTIHWINKLYPNPATA